MFLGIDIGTSGIKAVLLDESGRIRYRANTAYAVSNPQPLWSEQNPELWWQGCQAAVAALRADGAPLGAIQALGLAGQMHGATLLDRFGAVLRPCILWNDGRSHAECPELEAALPDFRERSGNMAMPGLTAPKLLWVRKHEPTLFRRIHKVLLPKDYIQYRLSGEFATDMSDAAGTLWLNTARRRWDDALLAATHLDRSHMPTLYEGCEPVGELSAGASALLGLPRALIVAGAGDNPGGEVGAGVINPGQGLLSVGTSGVLSVVNDRHQARSESTIHAFCHCLPNRWHQIAVSLSAANSLAWLARLVERDVVELLKGLEATGKTETPALFLPYLTGEHTPHNDPAAVGQFHGLNNRTGLEDLTLAVLEGVAFACRDTLDVLCATDARPSELTLVGGGIRSMRWRQLLADVIAIPLVYRTGGEVGSALGAARLAMVGASGGDRETAIQRICVPPPQRQRHESRPERRDYYHAKLERYRRLYRLTRSLHRLPPPVS